MSSFTLNMSAHRRLINTEYHCHALTVSTRLVMKRLQLERPTQRSESHDSSTPFEGEQISRKRELVDQCSTTRGVEA